MNLVGILLVIASTHRVSRFNSIDDFTRDYSNLEPFYFYKVFPGYDTTHPVNTIKAYAGYTEKSLLFLIEWDSIRPISGTKGYDSRDIYMGDYIGVYLSPFKNREFAYGFIASPGGGMMDYILTQHGFSAKEWDALWDSKNITTENGKWILLFVIPFKSIFFEDSIFFVNLFANSFLKSILYATDYNQPIRATYNMEKIMLNGFNIKKSKIKLDVLPYLRAEKRDDTTSLNTAAGGIIEVKPNFFSLLSFAYNPDFSTVDLDVTSLDVNIYPRYYPEKRKFFTEGSGNFAFSLPVYYSRNIDTLKYGLKGVYEKEKYSLYGIYAYYNTSNQFFGIGLNGKKVIKNLDPYMRILKDDSIVQVVGGANYYIPFIGGMLSAEGGYNFQNSNTAFEVFLSHQRYPGFSINMDIASIDTAFISKVGKPWYNNTLRGSIFASYDWILSNGRFRPSLMIYGENLYNKMSKSSIYRERSLTLQIIAYHNMFSGIGFREDIYGTGSGYLVWKGIPVSIGVDTRYVSPTIYYYYDLENKNSFFSLNSGFHIMGSMLNLQVSTKKLTQGSDSVIATMYGELPVYKKVILKPFIEYTYYTTGGNPVSQDLHLNMREFIYINRFTQMAFLQDLIYDLNRGVFTGKNFLFRVQLYWQIL